MTIAIRRLAKHELSRVQEIDLSETGAVIYRYRERYSYGDALLLTHKDKKENERIHRQILGCKQFGQRLQHSLLLVVLQSAKPFAYASFINSTQLVQHNQAIFILKMTGDAGGVGFALGG